ncbi:Crp/Fnr family transcriptional regulator [Brevundimonas naejangsanensis]|uniref:Crp/Fnr family transcriptional regulator n=1 Tax=Brevundimonas naejangsanensis TaxID=588932 RepID=UPI003209FEAD
MHDHSRLLENKLERRDALTDEERQALRSVLVNIVAKPAGSDIVSQDALVDHSSLLIGGFCARYRDLSDGRRQYTQINLPGDFIDLHGFVLKRVDHGVHALTDCLIAEAPHDRLRRLTEQHPHLTRLLWLETVVDAAMHREWLLALGRQEARERTALLVCEVYTRLEAVGLARDGAFRFPIIQVEIADLLGMSAVHVNRTLKVMREAGWLEWNGADVRILAWERLADAAEFNPSYLRLERLPV